MASLCFNKYIITKMWSCGDPKAEFRCSLCSQLYNLPWNPSVSRIDVLSWQEHFAVLQRGVLPRGSLTWHDSQIIFNIDGSYVINLPGDLTFRAYKRKNLVGRLLDLELVHCKYGMEELMKMTIILTRTGTSIFWRLKWRYKSTKDL